MMRMFFPQYGFLPVFITVCSTLVIGSITTLALMQGNKVWIFTGILWLILLLLLLLRMPIKFELNAEGLGIHRIISKRQIPWDVITKVKMVEGYFSFYTPSSLLAMNTRGFGGFLGKTSNGHTSYATDSRNNVWIELKDGERILISTKDTDSFTAATEGFI